MQGDWPLGRFTTGSLGRQASAESIRALVRATTVLDAASPHARRIRAWATARDSSARGTSSACFKPAGRCLRRLKGLRISFLLERETGLAPRTDVQRPERVECRVAPPTPDGARAISAQAAKWRGGLGR